MRAYAIKTNSNKLSDIDALLTGDAGNAIKALSDKFVQTPLEDLALMDDVARTDVLNEIASDTLALIAMEGG